ncbi:MULTISPECIES: hypothetical protein [unclassified Nonomuraea]|uniref:hypothetical protein n=1 Tax=unclassified Nonomuraea TaxID=2593643 RepID=UPI0033E3B4C7
MVDASDIQVRINAVLAQRRERRAQAEEAYAAWEALRQAFADLVALVERIRRDDSADESGHGLRAALRSFLDDGDARGVLAELTEAAVHLQAVRGRTSRTTLNIGVIGQTQMGKSTLLRSISGLDRLPVNVLPTSQDSLPTTATRSRISNSDAARAEVVQRDFAEFRDVYLEPRHQALGLRAPSTIEEFAAYPYPAWESYAQDPRSAEHDLTSAPEHLRRLREAQASLHSYRSQLVRDQVREIPLEQVADHVSYPPASAPLDAPRPYLAVRDVRIYCPFPNNPVRDLTLIDLPGTQERGIDVAQQFMYDLRNEVDLLLQIKRPGHTSVHFSESDAEIQRLARSANAGADIGDFMMILLNHDTAHTDLSQDQFDTASRQARGAVGMHGIQVLHADVVRDDQVRGRVLAPVLSHLAERLAAMDQAAFAAARAGTEAAGRRAVEAVAVLAEALRGENVVLPTEDAIVSELVTRILRGLSNALGDIVDEYLRRVQEGRRTEELDAAVAAAADEVRTWIAAGFGRGAAEEWYDEVRADAKRLRLDTVEQEFIRSRHHVSDTFKKVVDASMGQAIVELQQRVTQALWAHLPQETLPEERSLPALAAALGEDGHVTLATTVSDLAQLSSSYGARSLFLRIVQPIVVDIDVRGKIPGGHEPRREGSRSSEQPSRRRDDRRADDDDDVPAWARRNKPDDSSSWSAPEPNDVERPAADGLTVEAALKAVSTEQRAEETVRWVSETLTSMVEQALGRLLKELEVESALAVRALYACADQFFDGFLRGQRTKQELRDLCRASLERAQPDDGPVRLASILRELATGGTAVRHAFEAYDRLSIS